MCLDLREDVVYTFGMGTLNPAHIKFATIAADTALFTIRDVPDAVEKGVG